MMRRILALTFLLTLLSTPAALAAGTAPTPDAPPTAFSDVLTGYLAQALDALGLRAVGSSEDGEFSGGPEPSGSEFYGTPDPHGNERGATPDPNGVTSESDSDPSDEFHGGPDPSG